MTIESFEKLNIPDTPGVYFWKEGRKILYIGKATSLRDRIRSYFSHDVISTRGPRIVDMVTKSDTIEWQETDSVLEAMILEANLIKKHWPDYNVKEKDDRSFNYVVITREDIPRIVVIRGRTLEVEKQRKELKVRKTFGPFTNGTALREALRIIRKMFPFIDKHSGTKYTSTFYRQLGLSPDVTSAEATLEYRKNIEHIILFFEGKKQKLSRMLELEMNSYAERKEFEKAGEIKRKLFALHHIQDIALIKDDISNDVLQTSNSSFRIEAYDVAHMSGKETVGVMTVVCAGEISKNDYRKFRLDPQTGNNDTKNLQEIMERRFTHTEWQFPNLIVIDGGEGQRNTAIRFLESKQITIPVVSVVKDEHHKPKGLIGPDDVIEKYKKDILLVNNEAHRFAITYHRKLRKLRSITKKRGKTI